MLFELDKYDPSLRRQDPATPALPYRALGGIDSISLLYWAEHCVECAAPSCYQTCDLYQSRTDGRCRRFTFGAFKNTNFPSRRGYGVEISFKKWAKLEAFGNLRLLPFRKALLGEKVVEWLAPVANQFGKLMARLTNKPRWKAVSHEALEHLVRRFHQNRNKSASADAFLLEIYNPMDAEICLHLSFIPIPTDPSPKMALVQLSRPFKTVVACPVGYSRHQIDTALLRHVTEEPFVISIVPEAEKSARLVFLTAEFVKFAERPEKTQAGQVKCLVLDLDNTLWSGVLIENDQIVIKPEILSLLQQLDRRGILLSIASKNDFESTWKKLQAFGAAEYFLYPEITWTPKRPSLKPIAQPWNIGLDTVAFIDDNPFEIDEVSRAIPETLCLDARRIRSLLTDPRFQGSATPDSRRRRQLYQEAAAREADEESFGSDYLGFLAACRITLDIALYSEEDSERVAELVQRTNQLNFSGRKYTREELTEILSNPSLDKFVLKSSDRYGSYGTVGFCIVGRTPKAVCVHDFMLSCRVQAKLLEPAFFLHLIEHHNPDVAPVLWVNFRSTARNQPAQQVLKSAGFRECDLLSSGFSHGMWASSFDSLRSNVVQVRCAFSANPLVVGAGLNVEMRGAEDE